MRYLIGFLVTVGLIILIVFLLLTGGGNDTKTAPKVLQLSKYTYSRTAEASYIVDGPIQASPDHNTVKIAVSQSQIGVTVYRGYNQDVLRTQTYPNNSGSFAIFMRALDHASFAKGDAGKALQDERGICPSGQRTIYQFTDGTTNLMRFWRASCGQGTFRGNLGDVRYLFQQQIPNTDLSKLTQDINASL